MLLLFVNHEHVYAPYAWTSHILLFFSFFLFQWWEELIFQWCTWYIRHIIVIPFSHAYVLVKQLTSTLFSIIQPNVKQWMQLKELRGSNTWEKRLVTTFCPVSEITPFVTSTSWISIFQLYPLPWERSESSWYISSKLIYTSRTLTWISNFCFACLTLKL